MMKKTLTFITVLMLTYFAIANLTAVQFQKKARIRKPKKSEVSSKYWIPEPIEDKVKRFDRSFKIHIKFLTIFINKLKEKVKQVKNKTLLKDLTTLINKLEQRVESIKRTLSMDKIYIGPKT